MKTKSILILVATLFSMASFAVEARTITIIGQNNLRYSVEKIVTSPGEKLTIKLVNNTKMPASAMSHDWVLLKQSADPKAFAQAARAAPGRGTLPESKMDLVIAHTEMVAGGESDTVTFTVPTKPGTYMYICTFPGHFLAGMKGKLIVKAQ